MPDEIQAHDEKLLERAIDELKLRFDTVQIFVTRQEHGGQASDTMALHQGYGNWYARWGQIVEWMESIDCRPMQD